MFAQSLEVDDMSAVMTPGMAGMPETKDALHIARTCGVGGSKGKLVTLEAGAGFRFDTRCTERER